MAYAQYNSNLEHSFDRVIASTNRNETVFSPLKYNPKYLEDGMAWDKLKGSQSPIISKERLDTYVDHKYVYGADHNPHTSELDKLKKSNLEKLGSPLVKSAFHLNVNSYEQAGNHNTGQDQIQAQRPGQGMSNQSNQPYFDFNQSPNLRSNYYIPSNSNLSNAMFEEKDRFKPIIKEIQERIDIKNDFLNDSKKASSQGHQQSPNPFENKYRNFSERSMRPGDFHHNLYQQTLEYKNAQIPFPSYSSQTSKIYNHSSRQNEPYIESNPHDSKQQKLSFPLSSKITSGKGSGSIYDELQLNYSKNNNNYFESSYKKNYKNPYPEWMMQSENVYNPVVPIQSYQSKLTKPNYSSYPYNVEPSSGRFRMQQHGSSFING